MELLRTTAVRSAPRASQCPQVGHAVPELAGLEAELSFCGGQAYHWHSDPPVVGILELHLDALCDAFDQGSVCFTIGNCLAGESVSKTSRTLDLSTSASKGF